MPTEIEPIGAGLVVALVNKFTVNDPDLWLSICGCGQPHHEESHEDASSTTTSINDIEVHMHHFYETFFWMLLIHGHKFL